jgi:protocatechuate 3,4-dioxygenase, beta subunit
MTPEHAGPGPAGTGDAGAGATAAARRGTDPPLLWPDYRSSVLRAPHRPPVPLPPSRTELTAPVFGEDRVAPGDADLTARHAGEPLGERIIVSGRVCDGDGRAVPHALVEVWQANSAGRYRHDGDRHPAPLDPNFTGAGRCLTDPEGWFRFVTVRPGAYPWRNHHNAWRPAHIHFSVFGRALVQRLVTQMYFPGDPLFGQDPIFNAVPAPARDRLIAAFDLAGTVPDWALAYRFDIVLAGAGRTPFEDAGGVHR